MAERNRVARTLQHTTKPKNPLTSGCGQKSGGLFVSNKIHLSIYPSSRPSIMPSDMPSDMSSEGHCILMAVWGEDDARVPALVLYA